MDYIHDLRKLIGPRKIILNCAGALIIRDHKIFFCAELTMENGD